MIKVKYVVSPAVYTDDTNFITWKNTSWAALRNCWQRASQKILNKIRVTLANCGLLFNPGKSSFIQLPKPGSNETKTLDFGGGPVSPSDSIKVVGSMIAKTWSEGVNKKVKAANQTLMGLEKRRHLIPSNMKLKLAKQQVMQYWREELLELDTGGVTRNGYTKNEVILASRVRIRMGGRINNVGEAEKIAAKHPLFITDASERDGTAGLASIMHQSVPFLSCSLLLFYCCTLSKECSLNTHC